MRTSILLGLVSVVCAPGAAAPAEEPPAPNVVIVFADDQGYGDVGVQGARGFATPNLDRMAREDPILREILLLIGYLERPSLWKRIRTGLARLRQWIWALLVDAPSALGTNRTLFYMFVGVLFLAATLYFCVWVYNDNRRMNRELENTRTLGPAPIERVDSTAGRTGRA